MSNKTLIFLCCLVVAFIWIAQRNADRRSGQSAGLHEPLLTFDVEKVTEIKIQHLDEQHVFHKNSQDNWVADSAYQYPANPQKLGELILKLHEMRSGQFITQNTANYSRLGLTETDKTEVVLIDTHSSIIAGIDFGRGRSTPSEEKPSGRYVRPHSSESVYLIMENFDLTSKPADWLQAEILHIESSEVIEATLLQTDPNLTLTPVKDVEGRFDLSPLQEGDTPKSWALGQLAGFAEHLEFSEVYPKEADLFKDQSFVPMLTVSTGDGLRYTFHLYQKSDSKENEDAYYITIDLETTSDEADPAKIDLLKKKLQPWVYRLNSWSGTKLNQSYKDLVDKPEPEVKTEGASTPLNGVPEDVQEVLANP